ncbi:hypothetical protein [Nocardia bhagyanarayanae]|uniref:Uncharacterized protein n=1 Tax=Nocardia bhagyanarayanae TaxID=1215925 RepID=A0A543EV03_9NOCA|nr:hypothetical protein [Nocardia bhagyanarayanae]TQM25405.1 hypothetical protein FB390_5553 [Nocardia bhagyanarayanae]
MRRSADAVELITAFIAAVVGGLALTTPISLAWTRGTATLEMELLAHNLPRATAIGFIVAVIAAVFTCTADSAVVAWLVALFGTVVLLINHTISRGFSALAPLTTLNDIDSLAGGMLLGGLMTAAGRHMVYAGAATLGALTSIVIGDLSVPGIGHPIAPDVPAGFVTDSPPLWLLWPTVALVLVCALLNRHRRRESVIGVELPLRPILAALLILLITLGSSEWLAHRGTTLIEVLLIAALTVVTVLVGALLLPGRDGVIVVLSTAIAASGGAIVVTALSGWTVPLLLGATVGGMLLGMARPLPLVGLAATAALSAFAAATARPEGPTPAATITGCLLLALITGYCFGTAQPIQSPSKVLALSLLYVPGVVVALRGRIFGGELDIQRRYVDPDRLLAAVPGLTAIFITGGCALAVVLLYRLRPEKPETESADSSRPVAR